MNFSFLLKYLLAYLEKNPDVVYSLFNAAVEAMIAELKTVKAAAEKA